MAKKTFGDRLVHALWYLASGVLWVMAAQYAAFGHNWLLAFVAITLLQFVAVVIHELGHAWAARRCGARVTVICAVPFVWSARKRRIRFQPEMPARDIGGYVSYAFEDGRGSTRKEMAISAAGPLANFASAAAVAGLAALLAMVSPASGGSANPGTPPITAIDPGAPPRVPGPAMGLPTEAELDVILEKERARRRSEAVSDWVEALSGLFIALSIILGLLNLVPHRGSDGAHILAGWKSLRGS